VPVLRKSLFISDEDDMNEDHQDTNELLSAEEAAAKLKVSKKTLFKWAREGKKAA
jgi:hypothetical protein